MLIYDETFQWFFSWEVEILPTIVACCIELMVLSTVGLLAIWGGLGRPHWFVRAVLLPKAVAHDSMPGRQVIPSAKNSTR